MADWDGEFIFFQGIQIRTNIIIDISMSIRPMTTKFGKKVYLQDLTKMKLIKQVLVKFLLQYHMTN